MRETQSIYLQSTIPVQVAGRYILIRPLKEYVARCENSHWERMTDLVTDHAPQVYDNQLKRFQSCIFG